MLELSLAECTCLTFGPSLMYTMNEYDGNDIIFKVFCMFMLYYGCVAASLSVTTHNRLENDMLFKCCIVE